MTDTENLTQIAEIKDEFEIDGDRAIDFDLGSNDHRIKSRVIVDDDNKVVEAAVRFGKVEEKPDIGVGRPIIENAWINMVKEATGISSLQDSALEADLSDFDYLVPHLRVGRENVEEYDCETLTLSEFVEAVVKLSTLVERVFRGDTDRLIDDYL